MESNQSCQVCGNSAFVTCSQCERVAYCGPEHQKSHWPQHKMLCTPYHVESSDILGRYLIASRDIKQGEIILKEPPLIVGPRVHSAPLCLGCYQLLSRDKVQHLCSQCHQAPLCGPECEKGGDHTEEECKFLQTATIPLSLTEQSQVVLPLRCLIYTKQTPPEHDWEAFLKMTSHCATRKNSAVWRYNQMNIVEVLQSHGLIGLTEEEENLVQLICGILDVNSFEIRGPSMANGQEHERLRAVYAKAALMAHDCLSNTHVAVDDSFHMTIHASVAISRGQPIYYNYTSAIQGTWERQQHLREGKYFTCTCKRCSDRTELGTHMSSIRCVHCKEGLAAPVNPLNICNTLTQQVIMAGRQVVMNCYWECMNCKHRYAPTLINTTVSQAHAELDDVDHSEARDLELLLKKFLRTFPAQHSIILEVKQTLIALYRNIILLETNPSRKILQRKMELCKELLPVLETVEPGISRLKGIGLYELHVPLVLLANKDFHSGKITASELLIHLKEAEVHLREAVSHLLYEPLSSPEGHLARLAMQELKDLRTNIQEVERIQKTESISTTNGQTAAKKCKGRNRKKKV